jgi:hypothetical protein
MRSSIPGNPAALTSGAASLESTGAVLLTLADELNRIVDGDRYQGDSIDAVRRRAGDAADVLARVEPRYTGTAGAVKEFAVKLEHLQQRHQQAVSNHDAAFGDVYTARTRADRLDDEVWVATYDGTDEAQLDNLIRRRNEAVRNVTLAEQAVVSAEQSVNAIEDEWHAAADAAAAAIRPVLESLNNSFWESVGATIGDIAGFLAAAVQWVASVLNTVLSALIELVVVVVVLLIAVAFVLVMFNVVVLLMLLTGSLTFDQIAEMLVGVILVLVPIIVPSVYYLMLTETLAPTPDVHQVHPASGRIVDRRQDDPYGYLFENNGRLDKDGGTEKSVVEVVQVMNDDGTPALDENGNPIWRVTLPSTQDWMPPGLDGNGATNDLGSNLALIMTPEFQAAYERAVLQAMADAGIGPNDSVMLVGWSQGGILAGAIASNPGSGFNVRAIAVAGAPIDHMPIPEGVSVLAFQHDGDHVPRLDGTPPRQGTNWVTVPADAVGTGYPHAWEKYADTASAATTGGKVETRVQAIIDQQEMFFSRTEYAYTFEFQENSRGEELPVR